MSPSQRTGLAPSDSPGKRSPKSRGRFTGPLRYFDEFFENASDIVLVNDAEGWIIAANRAARELSGYTSQDVERGLHLREVLDADELEAAMIVIRRALGGLSYPEVYEREAVLRDGGRRLLELRSNVLEWQGRPFALQTIGRDVTGQRDAASFQSSLLHASQALLRADSVNEACRESCEHARQILQVDGAYLWLRDGDTLVGAAGAGPYAEAFVGERRPVEGSAVGEMYSNEDVTIINDFVDSRYHGDATARFGIQALLAVPLRRTGAALGIMVFTSRQSPKRFDRTSRDRALILGVQTTVAIEAALAREGEREEGAVSAALLRVAKMIRESRDESEILPRIARRAREILTSEFSAVALFEAARKSFVVTATDGIPIELAQRLQLLEFGVDSLEAVGEVLGQRTYAFRKPTGEDFYEQFGVRAALVVPMVAQGRTIGALGVGYARSREEFSSMERRIAEGMAAQAAVAVENARLLEALRRASELKSEFLGTVSHELRTPLSAILGYAELLRDGAMGPVAEEQTQALDRMLLNGSALLELINMTLDVNRLEAGRITLDLGTFDLRDVFAELRNEFSVRAADRSEVQLCWPETEEIALCSDRAKLKAVLRNLVDNALKFTARGFVRVAVESGAGRLRIEVRDSGSGIAPESQQFIFEMFRQVEGARAKSRSGVGLGLYLVKRYVELMGGTVEVESEIGEGATFRIDLPVRLHGAG